MEKPSSFQFLKACSSTKIKSPQICKRIVKRNQRRLDPKKRLAYQRTIFPSLRKIIVFGMGRSKRIRRLSPHATETKAPNIPNEIIYTILLKLPSKSLIRFKCVCKPWRDMISSPQFIKNHLSESICLDRKWILCYHDYQPSKGCFSVDCRHPGNQEDQLVQLNCELKTETECVQILSGSCNGLLLLGHRDMVDLKDLKFYLWNPSIHAHKMMPSCPYNLLDFNNIYGLCYSSIDDEYKLVLIFYVSGKSQFGQHYGVFRFKTNSWSEEKNTPFPISNLGCVSVNGAPHWFLEQYDPQQNRNMIVYFDYACENFKELTLPTSVEDWVGTPTNIGGRLGICAFNRHTRACEVWMMQDYGKKESWTFMVSISKEVGGIQLNDSRFMGIGFMRRWLPHVLGVTKKGEVVIYSDYNMLIYDPVDKKLVMVRRHVDSDVYLDSLVTPCVAGLI